ncbi:MAG: hypothetical protein JOY54_15040 [Acidobacteriaceae bacterium]|nr:hypothetical protein [Acidobacteriaceae bacterium]
MSSANGQNITLVSDNAREPRDTGMLVVSEGSTGAATRSGVVPVNIISYP